MVSGSILTLFSISWLKKPSECPHSGCYQVTSQASVEKVPSTPLPALVDCSIWQGPLLPVWCDTSLQLRFAFLLFSDVSVFSRDFFSKEYELNLPLEISHLNACFVLNSFSLGHFSRAGVFTYIPPSLWILNTQQLCFLWLCADKGHKGAAQLHASLFFFFPSYFPVILCCNRVDLPVCLTFLGMIISTFFPVVRLGIISCFLMFEWYCTVFMYSIICVHSSVISTVSLLPWLGYWTRWGQEDRRPSSFMRLTRYLLC